MDNLTLKEFTERVASKEPAPGGGSVSALSGTQAAALLAMYCRLSLGKKGLEEIQDMMAITLGKAEEAVNRLMADIERDTAAFNGVVAAYKLPKETEQDKQNRQAAIQQAFDQAARVPLGVAETCLGLLQAIREIVGKGNNSAISDIGVASLQAWAALQGAAYNVEINLTSLKDTALISELRKKTDELKARGLALHKENASIVESVLKGEQ